MQVEGEKAEIGSRIGEDIYFKNPVDNCFVKDMDGQENSVPLKVECSGSDEHVVENKDGTAGLLESVGSRDASDHFFSKDELGCVDPAETKYDVQHSDLKSSDGVDDKSDVGVLDVRSFGQMESLSCSIEKGLEKVTLVGDGGGLVTDGNGMKEIGVGIVRDDRVSDSESESDSDSLCETSSSSCSTSSASSGSDDDKEETVKEDDSCKSKVEDIEHIIDMEDGEIVGSADKMVSWTDNDDDKEEEEREDTDEICEDSELGDFIDDDEDSDLPKGPIKSKNELQALPPVPPVNVTLLPSHQISRVGAVSSVLGTQVIVEGSEKHNPLGEGSILWIEKSRLPLGIVDEIFGPVKTPYYIVRYNSESEVPPGIQSGSAVGFVSEFVVGHVLNDKSLYQKGYDASGENDEEVLDETEFSDDEKEAEYKLMLKMSKRGNNNEGQGLGNKKKNRKHRENTWTKNQPSSSQSPSVQLSQPNKMQQHFRAPSPSLSQGNQTGASPVGAVFNSGSPGQLTCQGNQSGSSQMRPMFSGGPAVPRLPQPFMFNGYMANGMAPQQPNTAMSSGFQMNGAQWLQQNHPQPLQMPSAVPTPWPQQQFALQFPLLNTGPCQQPFDLSQLVAGNNGSPFRPTTFVTGAGNSPWPNLLNQNLPGQAPFVSGFQNPSVQMPMFPGFTSNGQQPAGQSCNPLAAANHPRNDQVSPPFNQGFSSGRGRGRKPFHRRGGHFGGGRGRHQN